MKQLPTLLLSLFCYGQCLFAQQNPKQDVNPKNEQIKQKIGTAVAQYFELDRETIHAHFDKSVFFTGEEIWFKGYCFNKKEGKPFFETTNVFAVLYDSSGAMVSEQLVFSYAGSFSSSIKLANNLKSGFYHIRFYTNWMNNFPEDESSVYTLQIINENDSHVTEYGSDKSKINIALHPEGGQLVSGTTNTIGIRVTDCDGKTVEATDAKIVNSKGETITNFLIGKNGCGKVYFNPTNEPCKVTLTVDGKKFDAIIPAATGELALEVNNYAIAEKTIIKLRTNANGLAHFVGKPLFITVQQNNKSTVFETTFLANSTERELLIDNSNFYPGVNVIRIVDAELNEIAQRIICEIPAGKQELSLSAQKSGEKIKIVGYSNLPNADLSVAVLPGKTLARKDDDIFMGFYVNPYLTEKLNEPGLFDDATKAKKYLLDLILLNQPRSQYDWKNIVNGPRKITHDFDIGLGFKGTLTQRLSNPKKYRMLLSSPMSFINDYSEINDKNEFYFKNLVFSDAANFRMTLLEIPSIPNNATFLHHVVNRKRPYNKNFIAPALPCGPSKQVALDTPQFGDNVIALENIDLKQKAKSQLKYQSKYGNASLRGYKLGEEYAGTDLINFIGSHGFIVSRSAGRVSIMSKARLSPNGPPPSPEVYLDGRRLISFDELDGIHTDDVDEIYMNPNTLVASMNNNIGVIKIYRKEIGSSNNAKSITKTLDIKEGFAPIKAFEAPVYLSTSDSGFEKYGIIHWQPHLMTEANGNFAFEIPQTDAKTVTVQIEGMMPDGKLISVVRIIALE